jgi:hypothetical protein
MHQYRPCTQWSTNLHHAAGLLQRSIWWAVQQRLHQRSCQPTNSKSYKKRRTRRHLVPRLLARLDRWQMHQHRPCTQRSTNLHHAAGLLQRSIWWAVQQRLYQCSCQPTNSKSYKNRRARRHLVPQLFARLDKGEMYQHRPCTQWSTNLHHAAGMLQRSIWWAVQQRLYQSACQPSNSKSNQNRRTRHLVP